MAAGRGTLVVASLVAALTVSATLTGGAHRRADAAEPPPSPCADVPLAAYRDLDRGSAHAPTVDCARWLDVVRGVQPDRFAPTAPVRRDQMASLVARAVEAAGGALPEPDRGAFSDLEGNAHRDAIERLAAAGIVGGYDDGTYRPARPVPRGQMTAFVIRAREHVTGRTHGDAPDAFVDDDGHPHEPTIDVAAAVGIASGREAGRFVPDALTSRDETATFLVRLIGSLWEGAPTAGSYRAEVSALSTALRDRMTGVSWREGCPVGLDDLRLVELVHVGMDGHDRWGLLVVRSDAAPAVTEAFGAAHEGGFPVERMELVDVYGADDDRSMAANNTSAFNCRAVAGSERWSRHAYGDAVDVNPVQNPWVRGDEVEPPAGRAYLDRSDVRPGMLVRPNPLLTAFEAHGWGWGGDWTNSRDYQHLSATGG